MSAPNYDSYEFRPASSLGVVRGSSSFIAASADEMKMASEAWTAKNDKTLAVTQWHIHDQAVKAKEQASLDSSSMSSFEPKNLRDMSVFSTTSRNLKVGTLTGEELATQLEQRHATLVGWRPISAKQAKPAGTQLLAAKPTGNSMGSTFKNVPQSAARTRPVSARAAHNAEMRAEINTIRALPAF